MESALARPRQRWHYEKTTDVPTLAAAYGFGLCRNRAYRDGNKRVAFVVMVVFLELNGLVFDAGEPEAVSLMLQLADGGLSAGEPADWLRAHARKRKGRGAV